MNERAHQTLATIRLNARGGQIPPKNKIISYERNYVRVEGGKNIEQLTNQQQY